MKGNVKNIRKSIYIVFLMLFCICVCAGCQKDSVNVKNEIDSKEESENSKQENIIYALVKENWYQDDEKLAEITYSYDEVGRLVRIDKDADTRKIYDEDLGVYRYFTSVDGKINKSFLFEYDQNDNITSRTLVSPQKDFEGEACYNYIYEFDEDGKSIRCIESYEGEEKAYYCKFSWESDNLVSEELWGYMLDDADEKRAYNYAYGTENQVEECEIYENGELVTFSLVYNNDGKVEKYIVSDGRSTGGILEYCYDGRFTGILEYCYDANGNILFENESGVEVQYDRNGNIISILKESGQRYEYQYQEMEISSECILNGNDIAVIRQQNLTDYYPYYIPGWHHAAHIYQIDY